MKALIITEQLPPPASLRVVVSPLRSPNSFICRKSSSASAKRSLYCVGGGGGSIMHFKTCLLCFGFFLCFSFIFIAMSSTLDATSMRILAGRSRPQERRLLGVIEHITHTHVGGTINKEPALHGLGVVFSKGSKPMQNLIIANLEESHDMLDFTLFLRTLYRSGAMAKADLVLLFPWPSLPQPISQVLQEEHNSFKKLIAMNLNSPPDLSRSNNISVFNAHAFEGLSNLKVDDAASADKQRFIMWGENTTSANHEETHLINHFDYGSVVGFHMNELDSTDGFSEFLINPSSQLRRWLCHQMLLGLLRYKFKLVMLVELGGVVILDDVFSKAKKKDFLYLSLEDSTWADAAATTATAAADCNQPSAQGERQRVSPRGIQDDHTASMQKAPLHHATGQITMRKSLDDNDHMLHKTMANNKELIKGALKRRTKMPVDQGKGSLVVKRRKHEMMDKSIHNGTGLDESNVSTDNKRLGRRRREDTMGRVMGSTVKANSTTAREKAGHVGAKSKSLMEMVYGKEVWQCLEKVEKQRRVVSSRVIMGSMRSAKRLANSMAVEIVRVALQRNSKLSFPDRALLSYLAQKSTHLLGKRVTESLQLVGNGESMVHSVDNSEQSNVFVRPHGGQKYSIVQASSLNVRPKSMQYPHSDQKDQSLVSNLNLSHLIRADICAATADAAAFYHDCGLQ